MLNFTTVIILKILMKIHSCTNTNETIGMNLRSKNDINKNHFIFRWQA